MAHEMTICEVSFAFGALIMAGICFLQGFFDTIRWFIEFYFKHRKEKKSKQNDN